MKSAKMLTILVLALAIILTRPEVSEAAPMGTAFTYQGHLYDANYAANGQYDFAFKLYDANVGGSKVGTDVNLADVDVIDAYFTVELDFNDVNAFNGEARWLVIGVRVGDMNDPNSYTILSPRQEVTPTPYALYAKNAAGDSDWSISGSNMYSSVTGNVGIGTTSPGKKLDVAGGINATDYYYLNDNVLVYNTPGTGNFFYGWDVAVQKHSMATNGVERLVIDSAGNVGIGTTTPSAKLDVVGTLEVVASDTLSVSASNSNTSGYAVYGQASGSSGGGVQGWANNTGNVMNVGGMFQAEGEEGRGVYGAANNTADSINFGGYFRASGGRGRGVAGSCTGTNGVGVYGSASGDNGIGIIGSTSGGTSSKGVYGWASSTTGTNIGVHGKTSSNDGYAGYFDGGRNYFGGNVGIGTTNPTEALEVIGTAKADAFVGDGSSLTNLPLTPDTDWTISDSNMYSDVSGNVGIGTSSPAGTLEVSHDGSSNDLVVDSSTGNIGIGIIPNSSYKLFANTSSDATCGRFVNWAISAYSTGVSGLAQGPGGTNHYGVYGYAHGGTNNWAGYFNGNLYAAGNVGIGTETPAGILQVSHDGSSSDLVVDPNEGNIGIGTAPSSSYKLAAYTNSDVVCGRFNNTGSSGYSYGVAGYAQGPGGTNHLGVYGYAYGATNNWAGYFNGRLYAETAGIGTESPQETLDVDGTVRMTGFKMTGSTASGYVLTSNSTGQGSWQAVPGFSLPYSGSTSSMSRGISVTKTVGGDGIYAQTPGAGYSALEGYATGAGGIGVRGRAGVDSTMAGYFSATSNPNGRAVTGYGAEYGGFFNGDKFGVYGFGSDKGYAQNSGGVFIASGSEGRGAYGGATDPNDVINYGGYFYARGWRGYGVYGEAESATGVNYGVYGKTNSADGYAGYFEGNVKVEGEIKKTVSGGTMERATPIAYAFIGSDGLKDSGTPNVSSTWNAGSQYYEITISGESYFYNTYVTTITLGGSTAGVARTSSVSGKLLVYIYNLSGTLMQSNFQFVTYKP